jgi:hypothetical protein
LSAYTEKNNDRLSSGELTFESRFETGPPECETEVYSFELEVQYAERDIKGHR